MHVSKTFLSALAACFGLALFAARCATPSSPGTPGTGGTGGPSCTGSQMNCSGVCIDVTTSAQNCGMCGKVCAQGQTCQAGQCQCSPGLLNCNNSCVANDVNHCGSCT